MRYLRVDSCDAGLCRINFAIKISAYHYTAKSHSQHKTHIDSLSAFLLVCPGQLRPDHNRRPARLRGWYGQRGPRLGGLRQNDQCTEPYPSDAEKGLTAIYAFRFTLEALLKARSGDGGVMVSE